MQSDDLLRIICFLLFPCVVDFFSTTFYSFMTFIRNEQWLFWVEDRFGWVTRNNCQLQFVQTVLWRVLPQSDLTFYSKYARIQQRLSNLQRWAVVNLVVLEVSSATASYSHSCAAFHFFAQATVRGRRGVATQGSGVIALRYTNIQMHTSP